MSRIFRRFASSSTASAAEAAAEILQRFSNKPISVREQVLDKNQLRLLSLTFGRQQLYEGVSLDSDKDPVDGTPVPPGYHFAYFTPPFLEKDLGRDGTDKTLNPLSPWTRRMWAGGELEWNKDQLLRVGQTVREVTRITSAEAKTLKSGDGMILAGLEKTYEAEGSEALVDRRKWVFQREITDSRPPPPTPEEKPLPEGPHTRDYCQTDVTLLRFSALTFNAHKIHFNKEWCRNMEGHRDCVVHGPINLLNILNFHSDLTSGGNPEVVPKSIAYRAMSPLYVGEKYRLLMSEDEGKGWKAEIVDSFGKTGVKATIVH